MPEKPSFFKAVSEVEVSETNCESVSQTDVITSVLDEDRPRMMPLTKTTTLPSSIIERRARCSAQVFNSSNCSKCKALHQSSCLANGNALSSFGSLKEPLRQESRRVPSCNHQANKSRLTKPHEVLFSVIH